MRFRLLEARLPDGDDELLSALPYAPLYHNWIDDQDTRTRVLRMLVYAGHVEPIVACLQERHGEHEAFWIVALPVESAVPRPEKDEEEETEEDPDEQRPPISIEELYEDVDPGLELSVRYAAWIALSAVVAAVGFDLDDLAILIGAMIIAPLLTPLVGLALASALGDLKLGWRSIKVLVLGVVVAVSVSAVYGLLAQLDADKEMLAARADLSVLGLLVAVAAGVVGTLSYTTGIQPAQIGVMIAVALLPPLVAVGLFLGTGKWVEAGSATLSLVGTVAGINLGGVVTFLVQRVRPRGWVERDQARWSVQAAILLWGLTLVALALTIAFLDTL